MAKNKASANISFTIRLIDVQLISMELKPIPKEWKDRNTVNFKFDIDHKYFGKEKKIENTLSVEIAPKESAEIMLGKIVVKFVFHLKNMEDFMEVKNNKVAFNFPNDLLWMVNSISISTMRGIIISEFKGTHLGSPIIPVFDIRTLENLAIQK